MALRLQVQSTLSYSKSLIYYSRLPQRQQSIVSNMKCRASTHSCEPTSNRRSVETFIVVIQNDCKNNLNFLTYLGKAFIIRTKKLKEQKKHRLDDRSMGQIEEIKKALDSIVCKKDMKTKENESLHATVLRFRLLRQHGYQSTYNCGLGIFIHLKDNAGNFKATYFEDEKGILSLYEASHLAIEGESTLEEIKHFIRTLLNKINGNMESNLAKQRLARWFIDVYEKKENIVPVLIELAKLDFNMIQAVHQENAIDLSKWWKNLGLRDKLTFARDSMIQSFLWTLGSNPEPQFSDIRMELTNFIMLITTIDDIYDVYGLLEELELSTDAVERWDVKAMEQLPDYMKICFFALFNTLFNTINESAYFHLKTHRFDCLLFLKKVWIDLCKSYLLEAKWYHNSHKTTLEEDLNNTVVSIGGYVMCVHSFFVLQQTTPEEDFDCLSQYLSIAHWSSMIARLANDLGTSVDELKRADVLKSIQYYRHQTAWKQINKDTFTNDSLLPQLYIKINVNLTGMPLCV
ncbi:hypothetical protein NE237_010691 [Protea cynaroides]|uniref:Uncharacterized protein n=1 Tax=Protea cynaroides TaxID=273540 RepID=A0A9Q0L138_9MAGN|nr:hypothetical protein NE237_010691 [Protea cynaroides]